MDQSNRNDGLMTMGTHHLPFTPRELCMPGIDGPCSSSDPSIGWMQDIIDHEYALVESIPDEDRAALMPIIRFVRNTIPNPFTTLQESLHGGAVDAPKTLDTNWMQMHDDHGTGTSHGPNKETDAMLRKYAFLQWNKSHTKAVIRRHDASMPRLCAFRGANEMQHCHLDYNLNSPWHSSEGQYKQPNSPGALHPSHLHIKPRLLPKYEDPADEFHRFREGLSLFSSTCAEPSSLTSCKGDSESNFDNICSSLDMDSFNLEELRRSLRPLAHEMDGDVNGIQSTDVTNHNIGVDDEDDKRDEDDGNLDSDEELGASDVEWPLRCDNNLRYHPNTFYECHWQFPKVHCRRRNVIKKEVGWIKKGAPDSLVSRVRHKRKCNLPCCMDCETGTKRRKASGYGSRKCARLSTLNKITSLTAVKAKDSDNATKINRQSSEARIVQYSSDDSESCDEKEASQVTQVWENSPLTTALATVLTNSRSSGMTFCEALQALVQEGYSTDLGYGNQALASHVKTALKECPQFKQLKNHRFVVKASPKLSSCNQRLLNGLHNKVAFGSKNYGTEKQKLLTSELGPSQVKCSQDLTEKIDQSCTRKLRPKAHSGELQCCKTDRKHWQWRRSRIAGSFNCEHHQQSRCITTMATSGCSSCEIIDSSDSFHYEKKSEAKEDKMLETAADSCSGRSVEKQDQDCQPYRIRCCRTDGKNWQCSNLAQKSSMYCERHQNRCRKGTANRGLLTSCMSQGKKNLQNEESAEKRPDGLHVRKFSMQLRPRSNARGVNQKITSILGRSGS